MQALFSKRTDDWATPSVIFDYLERNHYCKKDEWFDPCPLGAIDKGYNGLDVDWTAIDKNIFINPPYSDIKSFVEKAIKTHETKGCRYGKRIWFLIPARTDTKYYKLLFEYGCDFYFIEGRLKFGDGKGSSTFPSVLIRLASPRWGNHIYYLNKNELYGGAK